jgi:hypothetical protein
MALILALLGVLGLVLLNFPFLVMVGTPYGAVDLASALQVMLQGASTNPAQNIWSSYPPQVYHGILVPEVGDISALPLLAVFIWMIFLGAFLAEVLGFVVAAYPDGRYLRLAQTVSNAFGALTLLGSLASVSGILVVVNGYFILGQRGPLILPGLAIFMEVFIAVAAIWLGTNTTILKPKSRSS